MKSDYGTFGTIREKKSQGLFEVKGYVNCYSIIHCAIDIIMCSSFAQLLERYER